MTTNLGDRLICNRCGVAKIATPQHDFYDTALYPGIICEMCYYDVWKGQTQLEQHRQHSDERWGVTNKTIPQMQAEVLDVERRHGWKGVHAPNISFGDSIALLHSEVSEAFEAYRDWGFTDATKPFKLDRSGGSMYPAEVPAKPEGVGSEFADILIRLLSSCDLYGINLDEEYERKMAYNQTRSFRHGGKLL